MSDLTTLMKIAPHAGAFLTGNKFAQERDTEALRQRELAAIIDARTMTNQQDMAMNPLLVQNQQLVNRGLELGLPSIEAKAGQEVLKTKMARDKYDSDLAATLNKNETDTIQNNNKTGNTIRDFFISAGTELSTVPPALRAAALRNIMARNKIPEAHPMSQQMMMQLQNNPDAFVTQMAQLANKLGETAIQMNPTARVSRENNRDTNAARAAEGVARRAHQMKLEGMRTERQKELVTIRLEAQIKAKQAMGGKQSFEQLAGEYKKKALEEQDSEKRAMYEQAAAEFELAAHRLKQAAKDGDPTLTEDGITPRKVEPALGQGNREAPPVKTFNELQQMYPNVPAQILRERFKAKYGVDIK